MGHVSITQMMRRFKWRFLNDNPKLNQLQTSLGYFFCNPEILIQAITHKSVDPTPRKNYERLEFLGDAVIEHIISEKLISEFPYGKEGLLTKRRSALVQKSFLAEMGQQLGFLDYISVKSSVDLTQEKVSQNQLANVFEALIGGMYLDGGLKPCRQLIERTIWVNRHQAWKNSNYKGLLIEYCHSNGLQNPRFLVTNAMGPEHEKLFEVIVQIGEQKFPPGVGTNKKAAEQEAALLTLNILNP